MPSPVSVRVLGSVDSFTGHLLDPSGGGGHASGEGAHRAPWRWIPVHIRVSCFCILCLDAQQSVLMRCDFVDLEVPVALSLLKAEAGEAPERPEATGGSGRGIGRPLAVHRRHRSRPDVLFSTQHEAIVQAVVGGATKHLGIVPQVEMM